MVFFLPCFLCSFLYKSQQGCKKYTVLSLCIINEVVFPKQPEIQVVPKQRGQKAYVTRELFINQLNNAGGENHLLLVKGSRRIY